MSSVLTDRQKLDSALGREPGAPRHPELPVDVPKRAMAERSATTSALIARLEKLEMEDSVTYSALSEVAGCDVQGIGRGYLTSARNILQRERGMVFDAVRGEGIKRLNDDGIVSTGDRSVNRIRRESTRGVRRLSKVVFDKISPENRTRFNALASCLGMLRHVTKSKSIRILENHVQEKQTQLAVDETLTAFQKMDS